jgi:signal transduction histidine kinase
MSGMERAPSTGRRRGLLAAAGASAALVLIAVVMLGLNPWVTAALVLCAALVVAVRNVVKLRRERARLASEVHDLEVSALLLGERIRVAREVHDLVSHGLGMITVRASSAAHLADRADGFERSEREHALMAALADVEALSREATTGLRQTLQALRDPDDALDLHPVETLEAMHAVIAQAETAGLSVTYRHGELADIPLSFQATVVALVREGLANAARHAGPTEVLVDIDRHEDTVAVSVRDEGPRDSWRARPGSGHGLLGLRERVAALGGTMSAGPLAGDRGYLLRATFEDVHA